MNPRSAHSTRRERQPTPTDDPAFVAAGDAFRRAEYDVCRTFLQVSRSEFPRVYADREILTARLARIEGNVDTWYAAAAAAERTSKTPAERFSASALRALAARRLGKTKEAERLFDIVTEATATATGGAGPYPGYLCAVDAWQERDFDRAERLARQNLTRHPADVETLALLGWVEVKRERFRPAGAYFMRALARLRDGDEIDLRLHARLVHAASIVATETVDLPMGRKLKREFEAMTWPASLRVEQFNTLICLRFLALLEGDLDGAWFASRLAATSAPSDAYVVIGETNAAVVTRLLGDDCTAGLQMRRAWSVLRTVQWSGADAEERVALTNFACEAARTMPGEARKALMLYISLRGKENRANALERDRRISASESWAAARVAEAIGEREESKEHYRHALSIWVALGFTFRAAAVALDLYRLTRDPALKSHVKALSARAPKAWLARSVREIEGPLSRLRQAQRKVLAGILRGDSAKTIAEQLDRSHFTVVNHTRKIFEAYGVSRRADLRAACAKAGVTAESLQAEW